MSTIAQVPLPFQPFPVQRRRSRMFGKNIWAMGDQVLISGANFLTSVLLARALAPAAFGTFTLVYSALLLANIFQSTLITQAHNVIGAGRVAQAYRRYTANAAFAQILLLACEALAALAVAVLAAMKGSSAAPLLMWVAPAIVAWQTQEFIRRVLYTECRFAAAFWNDVISYGGQILLFVALWYTGRLTSISAMFALASTSAAATALGIWQIRDSLEYKLELFVFNENWQFGKWLIGGELMQWFGSLQLYLYLTAYMLGTHATGELRAAQTVFGPARIFAFYLGSVLPIRFARALAQDSDRAVDALLLRITLRVLPLLGLYCALIAAFPKVILQLIFGSDYAGTPAVLSVYAIYAFMSYAQTLLVSVLTAKRLTHLVFLGNLYGTVVTLAMSYWIISYFKIVGTPIAIGISSLVMTLYLCRAYAANRDATPPTLANGSAGGLQN